MSIFVGVLLPTVSVLGNFMFDRSPDVLRSALAEGQSEMNRTITQRDFQDAPQRRSGQLMVTRRVARDGDLVDITVSISTASESPRGILTLHKCVLATP